LPPSPTAGFSLHIDPDTGKMTASGPQGSQTTQGSRQWDVAPSVTSTRHPDLVNGKTLLDPSRYKQATPEERIKAWRADIDAWVDSQKKELDARLFAASSDLERMKPQLESATAMNREDHSNYEAFIKSTVQARVTAAHGDPLLMTNVTPESIMAEFPFDSWARVPDASLARLQNDFNTVQTNFDSWTKTYDNDMATMGDNLYKVVDNYTSELNTYREWEKKYTGAQSGNSIAEQNYGKEVEHYNGLADAWQKYADADATWQAQKKQLDADIAAGKFRVQNAWKAILSGKLTPAQQQQLMTQLEAGEYNPNLGVPDLPPAPVPPAEAMPKEPPAPPALADLPPLEIDPTAAAFLGVPAQHAGGTPTAISTPDARTPVAGAVVPPPAASATPWSAPTSTAPATSSTGASGSTPPATGSTQTTPTGTPGTPGSTETPPKAPPPWAADHVPTLAEAQAYAYPTGKKEEPAPLAASEVPPPAAAPSETATPPAADPNATPPAATGSESTGTADAKPKAPTQQEIGSGVNLQGSTNQTLDQATPGQAPSAPQTTPSALSSLTSGAAIEDQKQDTGQTDGSAGQDKTTTDKKPQTTPATILAPFEKQKDIDKTPDQQDAWA
jgi:hypothetical protein